jgi:hypothetical protein
MGDLLTSPKFLLMRLAAETTVDAYLLMEDEELMELIKAGSTYETLLEHCNENY